MPEVMAAQLSPEWFKAREKRITASLAAAILGIDPYKGPLSAYNEIMGLSNKRDNQYTSWGRRHEGPARNAYEAHMGVLVEETGFWVSEEYPWLGASPDGLVGHDGLLEIKCLNKLPTEVPKHHEIQMRIQMACTGRSWCCYWVWIPQNNGHALVFTRLVNRSAAIENDLIAKLYCWYLAHITAETPPPRRRKKDGRDSDTP